MDLVDALLRVEVLVGTIVGLCAAALVHWLAPEPEPLLVEAGLVALGAIGGLAVDLFSSREPKP